MRSFWKLLVLVLLAIPAISVVGCGPSQVSSDTTPDNTGDDNSEEDDLNPAGGDRGDDSGDE